MPSSLLPNTTLACAAAFLLVAVGPSCSPPSAAERAASTNHPAVWGTYHFTSPVHIVGFNPPVPNISLELTADQAILHTGSTAAEATYTVEGGYVHLKSNGGEVSFEQLGKDTLRSTDAMGNHGDYVRGQ